MVILPEQNAEYFAPTSYIQTCGLDLSHRQAAPRRQHLPSPVVRPRRAHPACPSPQLSSDIRTEQVGTQYLGQLVSGRLAEALQMLQAVLLGLSASLNIGLGDHGSSRFEIVFYTL